jgi:hypothetical protein
MPKPNGSNRTPPFPSLWALIRHFESRLPMPEIEMAILETGQLLSRRGKPSDRRERALFLDGCHRALQASFLLKAEEQADAWPKTRA